MQRTLVVDASIARAAGGTENPSSKACRDFLNEILTVGHNLAFNENLIAEWRKHRSNFALQWLGAMQRRGKIKVVRCSPDKVDKLSACVDQTNLLTVKQKDAVRKDFLLLHCAWTSDELVSSLDEKMRRLLAVMVSEHAEIGGVVWVNPNKAEDRAQEWIKSGARTEEDRKLKNWPTDGHTAD
ncbi:hypothetical protein [Streptomyces sp. NPDC059272]|uniref:hypothetical protein n=1 Tax=Streptomyces sp. NPDC059272 TaxID=3346800 RepID=UPI0036C5CEB1